MDIAERLFNWFVASTLMASAAAVVVLAVQHLLRRRIHARVRHALWLIVLLRLMLPVLPQSPVSLFNAVPAWTDIKNAVLGVSYQWNKPDAISEHSQIENTYQLYYTTNDLEKNTVLQPDQTMTDTEEHITAGIERESHPAVRVLAVVWLTGAAVLLGYNQIYWLRFQKKLKRLSSVDRASILKIAEECRSLFSMKRPVGIYVDPSTQSPYITGIFRPAVYLPKSLVLEAVNEQLLKHVIAHELAHYKRKDTIWNMVGSLVFSVHWMNPFVWFMLRQMKADRELACDAYVLEKLGEEEAVPYGMTIIEFLKRYASGRSPAHLLYFKGSNGQREMIRRIQMIQSFKKGSYKFTMMAVVLVLFVGTATLTNARASEAEAPASDAVAAQEQQQPDKKKLQLDQVVTTKLQQVLKQVAGKEIKLQDVGKISYDYSDNEFAYVESVDGKYAIFFETESGKVWDVTERLPLDKISKKERDMALQKLKELYPNKTYEFDKEVTLYRSYDDKKAKFSERVTYQLNGKNFTASLFSVNTDLHVTQAIIKFDAGELEPKLLKTAEEAMKTVLNQDVNFKGATLSPDGWFLGDGDAFVEIDAESNKVTSVINMGRMKEKVKTDKEMTAKEAKEVVAPMAEKFFNIDITGYEAKWDDKSKSYSFFEYGEDDKGAKVEITKMRVTFDANKNVVSLTSGLKAASGGWN
ncbi:M56 family metallopeptidase [Paenibacillus sp. N3/727]|uniref:M56 family metallopeptidase n=1 Tax=Paenibacillus sp. N3/727 TaxID=2925845 RepID=UPI001F53D627|nr:M56 family metallopeptidase [Paenibacillus sp. N3/727]UNK15886.1 M56 family metallopeptidase [Paenibacillus sp. N3/727]